MTSDFSRLCVYLINSVSLDPSRLPEEIEYINSNIYSYEDYADDILDYDSDIEDYSIFLEKLMSVIASYSFQESEIQTNLEAIIPSTKTQIRKELFDVLAAMSDDIDRIVSRNFLVFSHYLREFDFRISRISTSAKGKGSGYTCTIDLHVGGVRNKAYQIEVDPETARETLKVLNQIEEQIQKYF